jgi:hypothetical protein
MIWMSLYWRQTLWLVQRFHVGGKSLTWGRQSSV